MSEVLCVIEMLCRGVPSNACRRIMSGSSRPMSAFLDRLRGELSGIQEAGTWKKERIITSTQVHQISLSNLSVHVFIFALCLQKAEIRLSNGATALNFCANNVFSSKFSVVGRCTYFFCRSTLASRTTQGLLKLLNEH